MKTKSNFIVSSTKLLKVKYCTQSIFQNSQSIFRSASPRILWRKLLLELEQTYRHFQTFFFFLFFFFNIVPDVGKLVFPDLKTLASDVMSQTNNPEWRQIWRFLQARNPVFLKHFFERKTSPTPSLFIPGYAFIVWLVLLRFSYFKFCFSTSPASLFSITLLRSCLLVFVVTNTTVTNHSCSISNKNINVKRSIVLDFFKLMTNLGVTNSPLLVCPLARATSISRATNWKDKVWDFW